MLLNYYQVCITFFCVLVSHGQVSVKTIGWVGNLIRYARNDIQIHQVVLLFDDRERIAIPEEEKIAYKISRKLPSWIISFQEATSRKAEDLSLKSSFYNPQVTTLFLIIQISKENRNLSSLFSAIRFISQISETRSRAKCVIVLSQGKKHATYDQLLRFMWSKKFLDVTILGFTDGEGYDVATVHSFNPFWNVTKDAKYSSKVDWFPDKTLDLHRYEIKAGIFHQPPGSYLQVNDTGDIVGASGDEILLIEAPSQATNFKILWVQSKVREWGRSSCIKENFTGLVKSLVYSKINLIVNPLGIFGSCDENLYVFSTGTKQYKLSWVVPRLQSQPYVLSFELKLFDLISLIVLFLSTWIIAQLLRFENRNWYVLSILQIVLGFAAPHEPRRVAERIMFGSLLISCMLYSSYIYTTLTVVELQSEQEVEMKTMDDLARSTLEPLINSWIFNEMYQYVEGSAEQLMNKTTGQVLTYNECLDLLLKLKNITCLVRDDIAQMRIGKDRNHNNGPDMKIVDEWFRIGERAIMLEPRSPFASRFSRIILRLKQAGLIEKWERLGFNEATFTMKSHEAEILEEQKPGPILRNMTVILAYSHAFSCVVFACEIIVFYVQNQHFQRFYERIRNFVRIFYVRQ